MITDDEIEKALDWLRDNSNPAAQARANRMYLEEFRRTLKGQIMRENIEMPVSAQEREAYADTRYKDFLESYKEAIRLDEHYRFLRQSALAKIEAWRTLSSNNRASGI